MFPGAERRVAAIGRAQSRAHEAAHAIVAARLGLQVHDIVVGDVSAYTVYRVPAGASAAELEADLVATLAGTEAEEIIAGPGRYGEARARGGTDHDHAGAAAARLGRLRGTSTLAELDRARARAAHLVSVEWSSIELLARSLALNNDELRGPECAAAIAAAQRGATWRRPGRPGVRPGQAARSSALGPSPAYDFEASRERSAARAEDYVSRLKARPAVVSRSDRVDDQDPAAAAILGPRRSAARHHMGRLIGRGRRHPAGHVISAWPGRAPSYRIDVSSEAGSQGRTA